MLVDIRWNNGGSFSQLLLERLRRRLQGMFVDRQGGLETLPDQVFVGPKVTLMNGYTSSDGDQFAYYFRKDGLGRLIGTRSWGGVRGIGNSWQLLDGTRFTLPRDSLSSPGGHWIIENYGVEPDAVVQDDPGAALAGHDVQLEAAVKVLDLALDHNPPESLKAPPLLPAYPPRGQVPPSLNTSTKLHSH